MLDCSSSSLCQPAVMLPPSTAAQQHSAPAATGCLQRHCIRISSLCPLMPLWLPLIPLATIVTYQRDALAAAGRLLCASTDMRLAACTALGGDSPSSCDV